MRTVMGATVVLLLATITPVEPTPSPIVTDSAQAASTDDTPPGWVVAVGGGGTPEAVLRAMVEEARRRSARVHVAILPQASRREDAGAGSAELWHEVGADEAIIVSTEEPELAKQQLEAAQIIWMPGGSQNRLLDALTRADLVETIRARNRRGALVGGTSAGAAILSERMLTGEADLESVRAGATETVPGLALCPGVIIDQHFHRRRRFNRLLSAVLDHPRLRGIGVDERTAVIFQPNGIAVLGESSVLVLDATDAKTSSPTDGAHLGATGVRLELLTAGMRLPAASTRPTKPAEPAWY